MTRGKQSFLGGAALLTVTMLVTKAIGALYKIPLGNLLDEQGMNYFYAAYNIYNLLLMVSTAGLPLALSRLVSQAEALGWVNRRRRIVSVAFWLFLLLGLLSSGLMFFLAGDLAGWMHNTRAEDAIRVLSPAVLCVCLVSVIRGYTQGMGDMRPTAASEVIESASKLMVGLGLAWWLLRQGYPSHIAAAGAIAGVTAGVILSLLALTVWTATHLSRDKGRDDPGQSRDILRQLLAIGVPITVGSVSLSVINLLDQSITMGILQTSWGLTEAEAGSLYGVYSYAGNLFALPAAFIYPLTISLIPAIGAALARGDRSAAGRHTAAAFRLTALLALPAGVGLSVLARPILELLYPAKGAATLEAAAYHLEILGVGSIFVCLMALSNGILQAYGREKVPLWTLLAGGGLKIALNYLMISNPDYGIRGLPVSTLCCYALITVLNLGAIARYVPERPDYFRVFSRPGLAALGMGAAAWWLHRLLADLLPGGLATLLAVALAAAIYAGAALLLGAVGREEAMALPGGETLTVADGQPLRLAAPATGQISVKARLAGTSTASPVLWPGTQLISGAVGLTADYATRSIPARGATKAVLVYDAVIPSGATVTPQLRKDSGEWEPLTADGTTNQGDGLVEYRFKAALSNVNEVKVKLTLTGTSTARPRVSNIRLMAVI